MKAKTDSDAVAQPADQGTQEDRPLRDTSQLAEDAKNLTYRLLAKVNAQRAEEFLGAYGPIGECRRSIDTLRAYLNYATSLAKELRV